MTIFPSRRPRPPAQILRSLNAGTGANGPLAAGQDNVTKDAIVRASAYKVFSRLVPDRQQTVDNLLGMAGLLNGPAAAFAADSGHRRCV